MHQPVREAMGHQKYIDLPDPNGETYSDGSYDEIISAGWPSLYPTRADAIDVHINGFDIEFTAEQLGWLVANAPMLRDWLAEGERDG